MAKPKAVPDPIDDPRRAASAPESVPSRLFSPLALADVVDIACLSRDACKCLPKDEDLEKGCRDDRARPLILEGARLLRHMAGEAGQGDPDEVQASLVRLVQVDAMLGVVGQTANKSCIGTAEAEKQECKKKDCGKRFCGCVWNSFLAKTNCFVGGGNVIPGIG